MKLNVRLLAQAILAADDAVPGVFSEIAIDDEPVKLAAQLVAAEYERLTSYKQDVPEHVDKPAA